MEFSSSNRFISADPLLVSHSTLFCKLFTHDIALILRTHSLREEESIFYQVIGIILDEKKEDYPMLMFDTVILSSLVVECV